MLKAIDIMQKNPQTVTREATIEEVGRLLIDDEHLSGIPVLDDSGALFGVITENDLISHNRPLHIPTMLRLFDAFIPLEGFSAFEKEMKRISAKVVGEMCSKDPITVGPETTIDELANIMTEKRIHHIPVMDEGKLVGMVTRHEVLKGIAGKGAGK